MTREPGGRAVDQQIRGSGSPTSMSTMRVPPKVVSRTTMPSGSAAISPTRTAPAPSGSARSAAARRRPRRGRRPPRTSPRSPRRAGRCRGGRRRRRRPGRPGSARLVEHDGQVGVAGQLVRHRPQPTPGRVAAASAWTGAAAEEPLDQPADRSGVRADVGLEGQVAAGQHHRHAVVADRARAQHDVARLHPLGPEPAALRGPRPRRRS